MSALKDACRRHLEQQGCTLWGRAYDVKNERGLGNAAEWLAKEIRSVIALRQEEPEPLPDYKGEDIEVVEAEPAWC